MQRGLAVASVAADLLKKLEGNAFEFTRLFGAHSHSMPYHICELFAIGVCVCKRGIVLRTRCTLREGENSLEREMFSFPFRIVFSCLQTTTTASSWSLTLRLSSAKPDGRSLE